MEEVWSPACIQRSSHCLEPFRPDLSYSQTCLLWRLAGEVAGLPLWLRWWKIHLQGRRPRFDRWVRKIPWRREWQPTPVFFPGEFQGQRRLVGYCPWGLKESDMTERLTRRNGIWSNPVYGSEASQVCIDLIYAKKKKIDNPICKTEKETQMYRTDFWTL